jgi:hypothetical protein
VVLRQHCQLRPLAFTGIDNAVNAKRHFLFYSRQLAPIGQPGDHYKLYDFGSVGRYERDAFTQNASAATAIFRTFCLVGGAGRDRTAE